MTASLIVRSATVARGDQFVLSSVDLTVAPGQRIGVVGPNGVGKSTLLAACGGAVELDDGTVEVTPHGAAVGWLTQEPERHPQATVGDLLRRRAGITAATAELDAATAAVAEQSRGAADRYDAALTRWLAMGAADFDARVGEVWHQLGLDDQLVDQPSATLSGGQAARVSLAALVLSRFDLYLLDEPTNDLDLDGLARLEAWVLAQTAGMLVVSHDRRFLDTVVTDVVEIDEFSHELTRYGGGWQAYLDERERARQRGWERYETYDSQRRDLAGRAQQQREWASQGMAKLRRSGETDKHIRAFRTNQSEQLAGKSAQTKRAVERLEVVAKPREPWDLRLEVAEAARSGDVVSRLRRAVVARGGFQLGPVDLLVANGDRIALVGPNGSGKTTLLQVMLGHLAPTDGSAELGASVVVGEIEQLRRQLTGTETLLRAFTDATGMVDGEARTLLAKFGLVADHVTRPTASLSPGERTRASLALLMATGVNLVVLDEPTNHLDLAAIEQLESALDTFDGTVIVVSHDREFLDEVRVTRTVRLDAGQVVADTPTG